MQKDSQDFVTEKMLTEYANDVLRLTNFPRTDRNISLITKELLDDASSSNIQAAHDNLIKNMYKGQTRQKQNSQLDGFYKDPRIDKRKNKVLEADSTAAATLPKGAGQTLNDFLLNAYTLEDGDLNRGIRQLDYKKLNQSLEKWALSVWLKSTAGPSLAPLSMVKSICYPNMTSSAGRWTQLKTITYRIGRRFSSVIIYAIRPTIQLTSA